MLNIFNPLRDLSFVALLFRLLLSTICGTAIGLERSSKNRPAGFRTHILVCLSGTVASITGHFIYLGLMLPADVTRIGAQIITGLGFIGAGTIIVTKKSDIKGLTTAAGLLTTGIIGLAIGSGFYEGGILGTILVIITMTTLASLGKRIKADPEFILELEYDDKTSLDGVLRYCKDRRMSIRNLQIHNDFEDEYYSATIALRSPKKNDGFEEHLIKMPGIRSVSIVSVRSD